MNTIKKYGIEPYKDKIVIYKEDNRWVAHSIETDQIGVDENIVMAIVDLIKGIQNLQELAKKDKTIAYMRKAPKDIINKANKAIPLPKEVYTLVCDLMNDKPSQKYINFTITPKNKKETFTIQKSLEPCY